MTTAETPTDEQIRAFLAYSDERDLHRQLLLAAWRDGYAAAAAQFTGYEQAGYIRAVGEFKTGHHTIIRDIEAQLVMWDGPREHFAGPRSGDHPGGPVPPW